MTAPARVGRAWSQKHQSWLSTLRFRDRAAQVTFDEYLADVRSILERMRRLDAALLDVTKGSRYEPLVRALQAVRGIGFLTAVTIVAEAGNLKRFRTAAAFMAYTGLVPTKHSSGASVHRGHLTKTGNRLLRHVLGEAAHHARHQPRVSAALEKRQKGVPRPGLDISWRCQHRLHHKYRTLGGRIGRPRALSAVARELAGFVWAIGQVVEAPAAA